MTDDITEADGVESLSVAQAAAPDGDAEFLPDCRATREHNTRLSDY